MNWSRHAFLISRFTTNSSYLMFNAQQRKIFFIHKAPYNKGKCVKLFRFHPDIFKDLLQCKCIHLVAHRRHWIYFTCIRLHEPLSNINRGHIAHLSINDQNFDQSSIMKFFLFKRCFRFNFHFIFYSKKSNFQVWMMFQAK